MPKKYFQTFLERLWYFAVINILFLRLYVC